MIWHIFRKDWKLLWWKLLIVEALLACATAANLRQGHFRNVTDFTTNLFGVLSFVVGVVFVVELAQLDPLDGTGQDWVARPIRRMDLLLAKLLFLFVAVVPLVLIDFAGSLASGIAPGRSLTGALFDSFMALAVPGLPVLAFASLFSGLTEVFAATFVAILVKFALSFLLEGAFNFPLRGPATGSAVSWVIDLGQAWAYFAGALVILAIQYFRRKTIRARWVAVVVLVITSIAPLLPWQYAFAVQEHLSPVRGAGATANVFFEPSRGRTTDVYGGYTVCIPIAVSGVANNSWLNVDSVKASVLEGDKVAWSHRLSETIDTSTSVLNEMRGDFMATKGGANCQPLDIPLDQLKGLESKPMRVELDYSLTLFEADKSYAMPAVNGDQRMPGVGWCQTRMKNQLELGCISDTGPACLEAWKTNAPGSHAWFCNPDYDAIREVDTDPWGKALNLSAHKGDTLAIRTYRPLDHFERQVTTSEIKLLDWLTAGQ